ncbi:MAG TPA: hypothetical protein VE570_00440 [Thermoleophilaceae bacterium]|nr:hypothetical protein [Thermoleophilaceae bacterium]
MAQANPRGSRKSSDTKSSARRRSSTSGRGRSTGSGSSRTSSGSRGSGANEAESRSRSDSASTGVPDYTIVDPEQIQEATDVYVDVPVVQVDEIRFEMDDLRAHVAVLAEAAGFVQLNVGAAVRLGRVELGIQGVKAQALLEVRLRNVTRILARVLTSLDRNPQLLQSVGQALGDVGGGARDLLYETGDTVEKVGEGAGEGVQRVGQGAAHGVQSLGETGRS